MKTTLDELDYRILAQLQQNADISNQDLAQIVHASAPTCLRRVRQLKQCGVIQHTVAVLDWSRVGASLTAVIEVSLDNQSAEALAAFEALVTPETAVLQCYRVSPGPDFILIMEVEDMPAYHLLAHRLFASTANVRNVRSYFSTHRAKFQPSRCWQRVANSPKD